MQRVHSALHTAAETKVQRCKKKTLRGHAIGPRLSILWSGKLVFGWCEQNEQVARCVVIQLRKNITLA
jgi:hypothetical protein